MFRMQIDSPPEVDTLSPRDRIVQRLALQGVPFGNLEKLQLGLVAFLKDNQFRLPDLVSAILPTDDEALEAGSPRHLDHFHESMVWLQWLMFEGEPSTALKNLGQMNVGKRGVCGAVWGNNDIAYRCRTCENDPTCAICVPCFQNGNHKDHDYSIIYTGGGCCDCGDVTAWKREGFCSNHKGAEQIQPLPEEFANSVGPVLDLLLVYWKNKLMIAETSSQESPREDDDIADLTKISDGLTSAMLQMLLEFCKYSESLLSFTAGRIFSSVGLLDILVRAERFLSDDVIRRLHELLLKLLGEPSFKYEFAKVFLDYYPTVISEAIKECSDAVFKNYPLISTFSVQIFTVPTLTPRLVKENNLLVLLLECLGDIFISCAGEDERLQVIKWGNLYETTLRVVEDIRFIMSHAIVPKYVTHERLDISKMWMRLLAFLQGMNPQKRETGIHIEEENDNIHLPFVLGHSIANIHTLLVAGAFSVCSTQEMDDEILFQPYRQDYDDGDSPRHTKVGRLSQESSVSSATSRSSTLSSASKLTEVQSNIVLLHSSVSRLIVECLNAIENWLRMDNTAGALPNVLSPKLPNMSGNNFLAFKQTLSKIRKGKSIFRPYNAPSASSKLTSPSDLHGRQFSSPAQIGFHDSDIGRVIGQDANPAAFDDSTMEGEYATELEALRVLSLSDWPDITYDVSSQDISVHIPLHRLLSLILQKTLRRFYGESTLQNEIIGSCADSTSAIYWDFFGHVLGGCHPYGFSAFVMEHPLRIRVFCAEVHAGMWKKNGDGAMLSWDWYHSVRWSEQGLELDLLLLQCCAALAPADLYVKRILERFGLSNFLSLNSERSSEYEPVLMQEMLTLLIQIVKERRFCGLTPADCLQRELIYKLAIGDATHSQLVKSLPRDLSKIDQLQEILDTIAVYSNPSGMVQGMYKLRFQYWRELDLYHPRWNSRDLQVAEERYLRFCSTPALTTQLPKWTKIYNPLSGVARVGTCKMVLQIVRAVLFYSVNTDKSSTSRAPDGVLLTALNLLSLALDICFWQRESGDRSCYVDDLIPIIAFACEDISVGLATRTGDLSLLSLLVSLMRMHRQEKSDNFLEADGANASPLIESLLKKFAEIDSGCMAKLHKLAPEVVDYLSPSGPNRGIDLTCSFSEGDMRKVKARERQAAIMEKMRAQQSKFLVSISSAENAGMDVSKGEEECPSDISIDSEESKQNVCSLCHDLNSTSSLSYLILLQKSRLLSLVDSGPPSWEQVFQSGKEYDPMHSNKMSVPSGRNTASNSSGLISSSQLNQLIQTAVNEFASNGQPREVNAFLEFIKARFPSVRNIHLPCTSSDARERTSGTLETIEEQLYLSIREHMRNNLFRSDSVEDDQQSPTVERCSASGGGVSLLLGKYIACLSKETMENPSSSENTLPRNVATSEFSMPSSAYDGFGPLDCDGIYVTSCGHAVHQACLDRYLSSLKERFVRRMVFEGGHIVDPDQGEFLCPVCRGLANSVLPALPGGSLKVFRPPGNSLSCSDAKGHLTNRVTDFLRFRDALSLLRSAADVAGRGEILKDFPAHRNGRIRPNLESMFRVLSGLYFQGKQEKISGSARVSHSVIMWDTLKYSLISTEIAARCRKTSLSPNHGLDALYKELKSSSGFILTLLLKIVQSTKTKNSLTVLLRLRGIQLFAESVSYGVSLDEFPSQLYRRGGNPLSVWNDVEMDVPYPDIQFWKRASDPVLSRDAFSSLMWVLFCLPSQFLSSEESFLSLVHVFYVVSVAQAIITYCRKCQCSTTELGHYDGLIGDISKILGEYGFAEPYFVSDYVNLSSDIKDTIRSLSSPYLRRCALLWKVMNSSTSAPFSDGDQVLDTSYHAMDDLMEYDADAIMVERVDVEVLEKMFKIPPLDVVLNDELLRSVVLRWFRHFTRVGEVLNRQCLLQLTPAVPFRLMNLPLLYQDLLQRYIKQHCPDCGSVPEEPALCLMCGKLCCPNLKPCCRENRFQTHVLSCGAGIGVFLLIRKTTILLQRSARQAPWPSPYLDGFGEEDIEMHRGKPLYLNEERYAALTHMVASHGLDRSSKVLRQTTIGAILML